MELQDPVSEWSGLGHSRPDITDRELRPNSRPAVSGIADSGQEGGHGNIDPNDPGRKSSTPVIQEAATLASGRAKLLSSA